MTTPRHDVVEEKSDTTITANILPGPDEKKNVHIVTLPSDASSDAQPATTPEVIPWQYKWIALACVIVFPWGQNWTGSSLGPLKNTLRNELDISNSQFGVISSADAFVNTVFPVVGGLLLDWYGPNPVTLCCTSVILVGSLIAAAGVTVELWRVLVAGHIFMGLGIAILDTAQQKFFYHWFGASGLAFAFGIENAFANTIGLVAGMTAIPIRDGTGTYKWTFWIPVIFCAFSLAVNVAYVFFERLVVPKRFWLTPARGEAISKDHLAHRKNFSWRVLLDLPWVYLMLPATQLLQSGAAGGFSVSSADIIRMKGYEEDVAGYLSTAQDILPIVLSPVVGKMIDLYGHRFHYVASAPIFWIIACSLLGFSSVHPLVALVFSSLAGVVNAMPLQICIPLLVADQSRLGTAFGLWRAFNNSGSTIMDIAFGALQDGTEGQGYDKVLSLAIGMKAFAFAVALIYLFVDYRCLGKGMTMTRKKREAREAELLLTETDPQDDPLTRRTSNKYMTGVTLALLLGIIITAWVVFVVYLI
ncbi:Putative major facilitator superfamily, MFS transporter superfamily [Septoria linicola]|uniref:Lysosomal dipeptide transporter MFSD1 n=1 Tax=Septoria linicola TaxID=215465 RepID=A0A9Q9EM63_9PEZI|nr:Putative major facilitator superfamily, MFS transporter superfamily [Septoria linicola]